MAKGQRELACVLALAQVVMHLASDFYLHEPHLVK